VAEQAALAARLRSRAGITAHSVVLTAAARPDRPVVVEIRVSHLGEVAAAVAVSAARAAAVAVEEDVPVAEVGAEEVDADEQHICSIPFANGGETDVATHSK